MKKGIWLTKYWLVWSIKTWNISKIVDLIKCPLKAWQITWKCNIFIDVHGNKKCWLLIWKLCNTKYAYWATLYACSPFFSSILTGGNIPCYAHHLTMAPSKKKPTTRKLGVLFQNSIAHNGWHNKEKIKNDNREDIFYMWQPFCWFCQYPGVTWWRDITCHVHLGSI